MEYRFGPRHIRLHIDLSEIPQFYHKPLIKLFAFPNHQATSIFRSLPFVYEPAVCSLCLSVSGSSLSLIEIRNNLLQYGRTGKVFAESISFVNGTELAFDKYFESSSIEIYRKVREIQSLTVT